MFRQVWPQERIAAECASCALQAAINLHFAPHLRLIAQRIAGVLKPLRPTLKSHDACAERFIVSTVQLFCQNFGEQPTCISWIVADNRLGTSECCSEFVRSALPAEEIKLRHGAPHFNGMHLRLEPDAVAVYAFMQHLKC